MNRQVFREGDRVRVRGSLIFGVVAESRPNRYLGFWVYCVDTKDAHPSSKPSTCAIFSKSDRDISSIINLNIIQKSIHHEHIDFA